MTKGVGTLTYMSPEMLNEEEYDYKTDVYSFGILLYFLFTGNLPKQSMKDKTNGKMIEMPASSSSISDFCIILIQKCLEKDPKDRPSFDEILDEMRKNEFSLASSNDKFVINQRDIELSIFEAK